MIGITVGIGCFVLHAMIVLLWLRQPGKFPPVARHFVSALSTHLVVVIITARFLGQLDYWPIAAVSGFLAVCWLFAFSAVYKSVSLRVLTQLATHSQQRLPLARISACYVRPEFQARVVVLQAMGCVEEVQSGLIVTAKGKRIARWIGMIQRACGITTSGLYGGVPTPACTGEAAPTPTRQTHSSTAYSSRG